MMRDSDRKMLCDFADKLFTDSTRSDANLQTLIDRIRQFGDLMQAEKDCSHLVEPPPPRKGGKR